MGVGDMEILGLVTNLGVAAPLVAVLWKLLAEQSKERREMTERHILAIERMTERTMEVHAKTATALDRLTEAVREGRAQSTTEHMELLRVIQSMHTEES